jgi:hypothetical protein
MAAWVDERSCRVRKKKAKKREVRNRRNREEDVE